MEALIKALVATLFAGCILGILFCMAAIVTMPPEMQEQMLQEDDWLCNQSEKCMYERECRAKGGIPHWKLFDKGCDM